MQSDQLDNFPLDDLLFLTTVEEPATPPTTPVEEEPTTPVTEEPPTKETTPVASTPTNEDTASEEDESPAKSYYEFFKEKGILRLPDDYQFDGSDEAFDQALEESRKIHARDAVEAIWNSLPEDFKPLLKYGLTTGNSLEEYLRAYSPSIDLDNFPIDTEEAQRKIIFEYYKATTDNSDERINKMIDRWADADVLDEVAAESLADLKQYRAEEKARLLEETEKAQQLRQKEQKAYLDSLNKSIDTVQDSVRKSKIRGMLFNTLQRDGRTGSEFDFIVSSVRNNPAHFTQLADIFLDYDYEKGFNLDRFVKQGKSQANKTFKTLLEEKLDSKSKVKGSSTEQRHANNLDLSEFFALT